MEIKAADVKKMREKTGAGMLDCKKALEEAGGDFAKAEKHLKELGLAAAAKRSDRVTNEGRVFSRIASGAAGLLELSCETDFVARNSDFVALGNAVLASAIEKNLQKPTDELESMIKEAIGKIKENITLKRFTIIQIGSDELVVDYIHGEGKIGVLVKAQSPNPADLSNPKVKEFVFDCALHVAAFNPMFIDKEHVNPAYLKEQEEIFTKQAEGLGKPANVLAGIIQGKIKKHITEICFKDQPFVKDDKRTVQAVLNDLNKAEGAKVTISDYRYYRVGEEV